MQRSIGRKVRSLRQRAPEGHGRVQDSRARPVRLYRKDDGTPHDCEPVDAKELLATGEWMTEEEFARTAQVR